jgi:ERCC4-type nuclease
MSEFDQAVISKHGSVPVVIQIDSREKDLYLLFLQRVLTTEFNGLVKVVSSQLPIGDIIIHTVDVSGGLEERVIIERKTPADLAASIRDGRYAEQSLRLSNCSTHNHNIVYLVEGDVYRYTPPFKRHNSSKRTNITSSSLISAINSLTFYKGFTVVQVPDMTRTCGYILGIARKIGKETRNRRSMYYGKTPASPKSNPFVAPQPTYSEVHTSRTKKSNITVQNISEIMLSQIPGVSVAIAKILVSQYGSLNNLLEAMKLNPECLKGITRVNKSGKTTKISSTSISNIKRFLANDGLSQGCQPANSL